MAVVCRGVWRRVRHGALWSGTGSTAPHSIPAFCCRRSTNDSTPLPTTDNILLKQFVDQIRMTGPITLHQYMRTVLTHPRGGYYMDRDVFGDHGDYITSPEISSMFGEMVGVWVYSEWHKMGQVMPLQVLELGPGRGTLMADVLKVLKRLGVKSESIHVHLVEISPFMRMKQKQTLCGDDSKSSDEDYPAVGASHGEDDTLMKDVTSSGSSVWWHDMLDTVPQGFTMALANEFLDVLPVHRLVQKEGQWREILIDINGDIGYAEYGQTGPADESGGVCPGVKESGNSQNNNISNAITRNHCDTSKASSSQSPVTKPIKTSASSPAAEEVAALPLRYVLSKKQTPASIAYTKDLGERTDVEVCPEAVLVVQELSTRITEAGGAVLLIDYGHDGTKGDTFRAFREHRQEHPLMAPGTADLTADVDFSRLRQGLPDTVASYGPVSQGFFLKNMGIELRLMRLLQNCPGDKARQAALAYGYRRLVEDLGPVFKVMALYPVVLKDLLRKFPPPGFYRKLDEGWQGEQPVEKPSQ